MEGMNPHFPVIADSEKALMEKAQIELQREGDDHTGK